MARSTQRSAPWWKEAVRSLPGPGRPVGVRGQPGPPQRNGSDRWTLLTGVALARSRGSPDSFFVGQLVEHHPNRQAGPG